MIFQISGMVQVVVYHFAFLDFLSGVDLDDKIHYLENSFLFVNYYFIFFYGRD